MSLLMLIVQLTAVARCAGDAVGKQHEDAQTLFGIFRRVKRRHGRRHRGLHTARVLRLLEVRQQHPRQHNDKSSHRRRVSILNDG